jgi:hypothetical protein
MDARMVITGGIHMSIVVDSHWDSCLCKEWYGKICSIKETCLYTIILENLGSNHK